MTPTNGELLRIARLRAGLTQAQVAGRVGRPQNAVTRWEASEEGAPPHVWKEAGLLRPQVLSTGEKARMLRERLGLTQLAAAALLGWKSAGKLRKRQDFDAPVSHVHVIQMERGEADAEVYLRVLEGMSK